MTAALRESGCPEAVPPTQMLYDMTRIESTAWAVDSGKQTTASNQAHQRLVLIDIMDRPEKTRALIVIEFTKKRLERL